METIWSFFQRIPAKRNIPPTAKIGKVNASISSLNPSKAISQGVIVDPILAPKTIPIPCVKFKIPAPINPSISIITTILLCKIAVETVPIAILLLNHPAYFWIDFLILLPNAERIVSSKKVIPNINNAIPESNIAIISKSITIHQSIKMSNMSIRTSENDTKTRNILTQIVVTDSIFRV